MGWLPGADPVAPRSSAVPGSGGETEDLVADSGHVKRTREHVDQGCDRVGLLAH
ncbi:hypothetical protein GALL_482260 [mine drainage metagenome]|uniref:Uncharacterized protein n=1 Tax=mine drainage metagenome TaxID=410659 RepID=A0A1J5PG37_9ZZZZ